MQAPGLWRLSRTYPACVRSAWIKSVSVGGQGAPSSSGFGSSGHRLGSTPGITWAWTGMSPRTDEGRKGHCVRIAVRSEDAERALGRVGDPEIDAALSEGAEEF